MNILIVSHEYPPTGGGGANACMNLAAQFADKGHKVTIVTAGFRSLPAYEDAEGVVIHRVKCKRERAEHCSFSEMLDYLVKAWRMVKKLACREHYDVCQVFFGVPSGVLGIRLKRKYRLPYAVRFGGGDIKGFQERFDKVFFFISPFVRKIWRAADALIANSSGLKELAEQFDARFPIEVIPNGVNAQNFYPAEQTNNASVFRILFVSRLLKRKGLQHIIPRLSELNAACTKGIRLTVVGDGPYREELERLAGETGCGGLIHFEGQKEKAELLPYYQAADVMILPSAKEGIPNVVLEAMACGLPIVMTPCQGSRELIHDNGYVCGVEQFYDKLFELAQNEPLRKRFGENSRKLAESEFTWESVAAQYLAVYERIVRAE